LATYKSLSEDNKRVLSVVQQTIKKHPFIFITEAANEIMVTYLNETLTGLSSAASSWLGVIDKATFPLEPP